MSHLIHCELPIVSDVWRCFLCEPAALVPPPGDPVEWDAMTRACRLHGDARLASGRLLADVLYALNICHNDDWTGVWLFNPVTIAGRRGWFSTMAGGWCVHGEAFRSDDSFEFFGQHVREYAAELRALHRHRAVFTACVDMDTISEYIAFRSKIESNSRWQKHLNLLLRHWAWRQAFAELRSRHDPDGRLAEEELHARADRERDLLIQAGGGQNDVIDAVRDLLRLAERRARAARGDSVTTVSADV